MKLSLIFSSDHPAVQDGGVLHEKQFEAGPVVIVVHSVLTHHHEGGVTLSRLTPLIQVAPAYFLTNETGGPVAVQKFSELFEAALAAVTAHQKAVADFYKLDPWT